MAHKDAEKLNKHDVPTDMQGELLRDDKGELWLVNDDYYKRTLDAHANSPDKEIELSLAKELLASDLHRLTPKQRDVMYFTMRRFTLDQIAHEMNLEVRTVRRHLEAAKKKLAKLITGTKEILKEGLENGEDEN